MELTSVAMLKEAWYRLCGTTAEDPALSENGEAADEVAYVSLTRGVRAAQRYMLKQGYRGWRTRSSALSWSGTDAANGGRYTALPSDFLRGFGNFRVSPIREANGDPWGAMLTEADEEVYARGNYFYFRGDELWVARNASPPTTAYLEYHYQHPAINAELADGSIDFPMEARPLIVAEAANVAKEEDWLPYGPEVEQKIERALVRARAEAQDIARPSKAPRRFHYHGPYGSRW